MARYGAGDVRFFDRFARLYDPLMPSASVEPLRQAFEFADRPVNRVVNLAGGTGRVADALRSESLVEAALVVDASRPMLARARRRGLPTLRADASVLPFRDGDDAGRGGSEERDGESGTAGFAIDAAVVVDAFHHLPDQSAMLAEAARVIAPGGVVVIRDFDPSTLPGRAIETGEALVGMASRFVDADEAAAELSRVGLHSRVLDRGVTYTVVARRPAE
jgi:demethylmenaquinone methyltransferase/2-methoxy-6-polyprenyl-1,4-benzoquinol methylase